MLKKLALSYALSMLIPVYCSAQTAVFKCEENGHTAWSEYPCKSKGKAVRIKPLSNGKPKNNQNAETAKPEDKPTTK